LKEKTFLTQIGFGVDQHCHRNDCTNAAINAITNAISNNCLQGISEICHIKEPKDLSLTKVHVKIGAPYPESVDEKKALKALPLGEKSIEVVKGGLIAKGILIKELGDNSDDIIVCIAAVTVSVKI
jgi:uncharacterized protein (TIGR02058 family)